MVNSSTVRLRPQLRPLVETEGMPGVRLVYKVRTEGNTTRIFALDPPPPLAPPGGGSLGFVGDGTR